MEWIAEIGKVIFEIQSLSPQGKYFFWVRKQQFIDDFFVLSLLICKKIFL